MFTRHLAMFLDEFQDASPKPRQKLPRVIQFPINDICNSRCQMCLIWERKRDKEISPTEVRRALSSPLFRKVHSVGINGGEPTLRKDLADIAEALCVALPDLRTISLITNGWKSTLIIERINALQSVCQSHGIHLDVMVSLDGVGAVHDLIRGRAGNFAAACEVLDYLKSIAPTVTQRIGTTIVKDNVYDLENILAWAIEKKIYARFRLGIPHARLYAKDLTDPFTLNDEKRYHLAAFLDELYFNYETGESRRQFYRSLRNQIVYGAPRASGCYWKNKGVTLLPTGELAYCAVESQTLGCTLSEKPWDIYWNNADHLSDIVNNKCDSCLHDYEGFADRNLLVTHYAKKILKRAPPPIRWLARHTHHCLQSFRELGRLIAAAKTLRRNGAAKAHSGPVLMAGWYGTETIGDKAILGAVVQVWQEVHPDRPIDIAALEPYVTRETIRQMPELGVRRVVSLAEAKQLARQGDYGHVVIAGGPMMAPVPAVVDLVELFAAAHGAGSKTVVAGCGVGPLGPPIRNQAIRLLFEHADAVVVRDSESARTLARRLKIDRDVPFALDPAVLWIKQNLVAEAEPRADVVLLALRDWPIDEYGAGNSKPRHATEIKEHFDAQLLKFVHTVATLSPDTKIVPYCMHTLAIGGDDRAYYRRLFAGHHAMLSNLSNRHQEPIQALRAFATARGVLAMRFHSVVFAAMTQTPFLAIDYTSGGKIKGFLTDLDAQDRLIEIIRFDGEEVARRLLFETQGIDISDGQIERTRKVLRAAASEPGR